MVCGSFFIHAILIGNMADDKNLEYWSRFLLAKEEVIHDFGVSRWYITIFFLLPSILLMAVAIFSFLNEYLIVCLLLAFIALVFFVPAIYLAYFVHYVVTSQRVISREGIFHKKFIAVDLPSITDVTISEAFLERLITKSGIIGLNTAGSHHIELSLRHISRPFNRRKDIYKHLGELTGQTSVDEPDPIE